MRNILKQFIRTLNRKGTISIITIGGHAISMAVVFILAAFIISERSVDTGFPEAKHIYRIVRGGDKATVPQTFLDDVKNKVSGIDKICLYSLSGSLYEFNGQKEHATFLAANDEFMDIFSFKFIYRPKQATLSVGNNIYLTQKFSQKLFGNNNPIGETLNIKNEIYNIVAVISDPPKNSSFGFDIVTSLDKPVSTSGIGYNKEEHTMFKSFVLLNSQTNPEIVNSQIAGIITHWQAFKKDTLSLQPFNQVYFDTKKQDDLNHANVNMIFLLSCVAAIILFMTIFNYVNMTISSSYERMNEIGIRKATGAARGNIFLQFITESLLVSFLSMALALFLTVLVSPLFTKILDKEVDILYLLIQPRIIGVGILIFILVGTISGLYPALVVSKITPIQVISRLNLFKRANSRAGVIAVQFFVTIVLITSLLFINKQIQFVKHKDLGFDQQLLLKVDLEGNASEKWEVLKNKLLTSPSILSVSASDGVPMEIHSSYSGSFNDSHGKEVKLDNLKIIGIDDDFLKTFGLTMVAGEQFKLTDGNVCLINEHFYKTLGWNNLTGEKILGATVVGVVKDFNYLDLYNEIGDLKLEKLQNTPSTFNIKITGDVAQNMNFIKKTFDEIEPGTPFNYQFYDDWVQSMYQKEEKQAYAIQLFAILAIIISCMGLIGLAQNSTTLRTKEIGIRKVNGARISEILTMLNRDFIKWVAIAFVIATPIAYYAMNKWLENFAYKTSLSWWIFALSGLLALGIALLTVSWQSWKA
ncbi:MAG: FtsX-like permease family protein, partial [Bacteroidales bacterium]